MNTIGIRPELLTWARERAGLDTAALAARFPRLKDWEAGSRLPTLRQLEDFARAVHVPIGYLFLATPPAEALPIPDFRTRPNRAVTRPSPDLLDTIYLCQQRQDWFRDYSRLHGLEPIAFVGSARVEEDAMEVAGRMRDLLALSTDERRTCSTWTDALRQLISKAEDAGVLVMASSIVGSNSHRKLDVDEFQGFALSDDRAPLVFVNAADSKAAQMFTLAHELAHLWLGESGISDPDTGRLPGEAVERWCNTAAAELLLPMADLHQAHRPDIPVADAIQLLAREFKVSTLVALRRLFDGGLIDQARFWQSYREERSRISTLDRGQAGGGDFYRTLGARTGKRFARAVLGSALEGQTLFQDAFRMLGVRRTATFYEAARELGVMV